MVSLDRASFVRLLGPVDHILKRNLDNYEAIEKKIYDEKIAVKSKIGDGDGNGDGEGHWYYDRFLPVKKGGGYFEGDLAGRGQ